MILAVAFLIAGLGLTLNAKGDKLEVRAGAAAGITAGHPAEARSKPATANGAGTERTIPNPAGGPRAAGHGTPVGQVYRLPDGRLVYVKGNHRAPR
jgi:hypothetical protein